MQSQLDYVRSLPQPIEEERLGFFLSYCKKNSLDADWHLRRCIGFGGSDIAALVREKQGLPANFFSSARSIVKQKLLMEFPSLDTRHTRRGKLLEDLARTAYLKKYGAVVDKESMSRLSSFKPPADMPWLYGQEDCVTLLKGARELIDFKVPEETNVIKATTTEADYALQLHHYGLKGKLAGVEYDTAALVVLDIEPSVAAAFCDRVEEGVTEEDLDQMAQLIVNIDKPGMRLIKRSLSLKPQVYDAIKEAGNYYWNEYVLKGDVPDLEFDPAEADKVKSGEELAACQAEIARVTLMVDKLNERRKKVVERANELINGATNSKQVQVGPALPSIRNKFDSEGAIAELSKLGYDKKDFVKEDSKRFSIPALTAKLLELGSDLKDPRLYESGFDNPRIKKALEKNEIPESIFMAPSVTWGLGKSKEAQTMIAPISEQIEKELSSILDDPETSETNLGVQ